MQFHSLNLVLSILTLSAAVSAACNKYVIVSTRGTGEPQGPSAGYKGMIAPTLQGIPNGTEYDTVYPAKNEASSQGQGTADILRYVRAGLASCPDQKYILMGYSQGAAATAAALQQIGTDSAAGRAVLAVLTIGNPSHKPFQHANTDQDGRKTTDAFFGALYDNGKGAVPDTWYASGKYLDICAYNDIVCMATLAGIPLGFVNHLSYAITPSVQQMGANFLTNRLYQAGLSPVNASQFGINPA